jgi:hypothetical protein
MAPLEVGTHAIGAISMGPSEAKDHRIQCEPPAWSPRSCWRQRAFVGMTIGQRLASLGYAQLFPFKSRSADLNWAAELPRVSGSPRESEPMHLDRRTWQRVSIGTSCAMVVGSYFRTVRPFYVMKQASLRRFPKNLTSSCTMRHDSDSYAPYQWASGNHAAGSEPSPISQGMTS